MAGNNTFPLPYNVLQCNGAALALGADLTSGATSISFPDKLTDETGANVATLAGDNYIRLVLWDTGAAGVYAHYEIVWLTAYTAGATSGTIARGKEGTTAAAHTAASTTARCAATIADFVGDPSYLVVGAGGAPAFTNSWGAYGAPWGAPRFKKLGSGLVVMAGLALNGSSVSTSAFTLPVGYRPGSQFEFYSADSGQSVLIKSDGTVQPASATTLIGLDCLNFFAEG